MTESNPYRDVIEEAITRCVSSIMFQGIEGAKVTNVEISPGQLREVAFQFEEYGKGKLVAHADIAFCIRIPNVDVLRSDQRLPFRVSLVEGHKGPEASAIPADGWESAWQKGLEPIRQAALASMKDYVHTVSAAVEGTYSFQAALILVASEILGPYPGRIATFLGYPVAVVQVVGDRLHEAGIWTADEVRNEGWSDPLSGYTNATLDVMVAQGRLRRRWSEGDQQFQYYAMDLAKVTRAFCSTSRPQ